MKNMRGSVRSLFAVCFGLLAILLLPLAGNAQQPDPSLFSGLRWRMIGPFRGGRSNAVTGVPGQPNHFYFGSVGGGVWESFNSGETWTPIFDSQPVQSIGAIAVAPSDVKVIYVGTGEADMRSQISYGNGMYKSTDAGKTWTHIGLDATRQIGRIIVDPHDANLVYVAALGHVYGPNEERGVYRSSDGGATWQKILYKDPDIGAIDLNFDPRDSKTIYAALWATRRPPWSIYPPAYGPGSGIFKSTDGGNNWQQLTNGLPAEGLGRIGVAVAPSEPNRVYAIVDAKAGGLYRSDDGGATWRLSDSEARIWGRGWYFCNVVVDPKNPDVVYVSNTSTYVSRDGGKSFVGLKGAPGGDDYHQLWVYPDDGQRMILASDQGTEVSVDGGSTWSSWYNQPTAEIYHIVADNRDPYSVYGAQQDSGAVKVETRSVQGSITYLRGWSPICAGGESGYMEVDPKNADILYGGTVGKCSQETNAGENISPMLGYPELGPFRHTWSLPLVFSQAGTRALYFGNQYLWRTTNGGESWDRVSPDLTREDPGMPANLDDATKADSFPGPRQGVIYTIAPSPLLADTIWIGTDDGYIQVTHDGGKSWKNVTPPELTGWSKVSMMEASRFDANEAYAAVDRHRLEDYKAYIYRTRDTGKTWQQVSNGIPEGDYVSVIRADTVTKGLLFAGTELGVYVSFDDGDHWQPLQLNLPHTSARDFVVHGDDLVVATHGRGFWVLDDISALRQMNAKSPKAPAYLFKPAAAIRRHAGGFGGTPLPFGSPEAENPPSGAIIDYYLNSDSSDAVTMEILDSAGRTIRKYSSADHVDAPNPATQQIPAYWLRTPEVLSAKAGMHRWTWDLHYASVGGGGGRRGGGGGFGGGSGLWAIPGTYSVKLTVAGQSYTQPFAVKMDSHVKATVAALQQQFTIAQEAQSKETELNHAIAESRYLREQIHALREKASGNSDLSASLDALNKKADELGGVAPAVNSSGTSAPDTETTTLLAINSELASVLGDIEGAEAAPTVRMMTAYRKVQATMATTMAKWNELKAKDVPALDAKLKSAGLPAIDLNRASEGGRAGRGGRGVN